MLIHNWFEEVAKKNAGKTALSMDGVSLSYSELNRRASKLSSYLINLGVKPNDVVGISMKRSPDLIVSVLAILKTGASYLPLDTEYPVERLNYMKTHSKVGVVLDEEMMSAIDWELLPESNSFSSEKSDALAYVIYTSGSTGNPKGVCLSHKALVNLIEWQNKQTRDLENLITLQFTPLSFDVHFQEIFSTLLSGGHLVLIREDVRLNPVELIKTMTTHKVGRIFLPYVALNQLAETAVRTQLFPTSLKEITTAGEQLKITPSIREFCKKLDGVFLYNHYGPSETHVVTSHTLSGNPDLWDLLPSIGSAIDNVGIHLLNEELLSVEKGSEGDLYISGVCLAEGYLNAPELTAEKFFVHSQLGRLYKTGDIAIENLDGSYHFLGRKDGQVKIRGYRVEVGEIEATLLKNSGLKNVAIKVIESDSEKILACYFVGDASVSDLRKNVSQTLPDYMMPSYFIKLNSLPLTPSGKVDYKLLPTPSRKRPELMNELVSPSTDLEQKIARIWMKYLNLDQVGITDNFFALGGNSLLAIRIMVELNLELTTNLSVVDFFLASTIKQLTDKICGEDVSSEEVVSQLTSDSADIAVIGVAGRFPGANSVNEFWENLLSGKVSTELFDPSLVNSMVPPELTNDPNYVFVHGSYAEQKSFDFKFFGITPREAELMDPQQRKFLEIAVEALENAGHFTEKTKEVVGVFAGMGNSKYSRLVDQHADKIAQVGEFNVMIGLEKDYIATRVSHKLNLTGPSLSLHTGCSTSLVAIIEAVKSLRAGDCSMALAGGIAISGTPFLGHLSQEGGILSRDGICRPFDENATGTIFTDGAGIVVLKKLDSAIRDNDQILAVIKGVGINNDGADKMSFTAPSAKGQTDAIRKALRDAKVDPRTINYVEAHGTATPVGDPIEFQALKKAFEGQTKEKSFCYLSSVKANVGHLTAAAGVTGFIKALLVVNKGIVPPTANFSQPNKLLNLSDSPFLIPIEATTLNTSDAPRRAGVSSFGVGGTNGHVIIEEYIAPKKDIKAEVSPVIFKLSAKSEKQVLEMESQLISHLSSVPSSEWAKIAFTLEVGRKEYPFRKVLIGKTIEEIKLSSQSKKTFNHFKKQPSLHMMFPGQGSQYFGMGKELYQDSLVFRSEFEKCCAILEQVAGYNLKKILFNDVPSEDLNNTYYTQPAIFVIEYSIAKMLMDMGFRPDGFIGHSIGEYVAATLAGIFSLEDGIRVIAKRAELMQSLPSGVMISVSASKEVINQHLESFALDIAAVNGSSSIVLAGLASEITKYQDFLEKEDIASVILKTSHAFHSRMMKPIVSEFELFLDTIKKNIPQISILSTVSLNRNDPELLSSNYWAEHVLRTVQFAPAMTELIKNGDVLLLEAGPRNVLTNLSRKQALVSGQKDIKLISSLSDKGTLETSTLMTAIGELWVNGLKVSDPRILFRKEDQFKTSAPTYVFEKNHVWLESINKSKNIISHTNPVEHPVTDQKKKQLSEKLVDLFETSSGIEVGEFGKDVCFLEMGMDSLFLTQISLQLKKELKINVTFRQLLEEFSTINLLTNAFVDKVAMETAVVEQPLQIKSEPPRQIEVQQFSKEPIAELPVLAGSSLELIIQRQLELMGQQIQLLSNQKVSAPASPKIQNAPASAPAAVKPVRGADIKTAKDSFGAAPKINIEKNSKFTETQKKNIDNFFQEYINKTSLSKKFTQDTRRIHADPRVVTGFKPENKEIIYPIVVKKSEAQYLWDLNDNKYIDMTCGFGSNFFGNGNKTIKALVTKQLDEGIELGPQHPLVGEVSKLICDLTGNDRAAFCNTGSEAVLGAMRLARTVTGREKIVVFSGSYHGINDEVIIRTARDKSYPAAPGINGNAVSNMIVLEYGTEETLTIIRNMADELAAVMVEPVQSRRCNFHPKDFLKEVRKITADSQTCLIFDEIITGFRIHPAGAQGHFGIRADLCTYGKIVGGGMPIGVISGKTEYMDALDGGHWEYGDESTPTVGVTYFAGTFVRHPLALAAAKGALEILRDGGVEMFNDLNSRAQKFVDELNSFLSKANVPLEIHNFGSLMKPKWTSDVLGGELLFALLRKNGVHVYDGFPWFINLAHTDNDIKIVLETFKDSVRALAKMGLLPQSNVPSKDAMYFNQNNPPVPHAKLGKNEQGHPAWFIENPNKAGEYYSLEQ